jgi:hypothetical protein
VTGINIHSSTPLPLPNQPTASQTLLDTIKSVPNQHLWKSLHLDGDVDCILDGLTERTVVKVHDGSYMEDLDDSACSSGGVIICIRHKRTGTFTTMEWTDSETVSNYQGEVLGAIVASNILHAATSIIGNLIKPMIIACNNI